MKATREDILSSGLQIINARGLSALSLRAVAEDLGLSPGNVTYHFARKETLVAALTERLGDHNRGHLDREIASVGDFLERFRELFHGQYAFRGLVIALPDVLATFEELRASYRRTQKIRRQQLRALLVGLRDREELTATDDELARVVAHLTLIGRFWIAEARVSYSQYSEARIVGHYLALIADTLVPYATSASRRELEPYRAGWIDIGDSS